MMPLLLVGDGEGKGVIRAMAGGCGGCGVCDGGGGASTCS